MSDWLIGKKIQMNRKSSKSIKKMGLTDLKATVAATGMNGQRLDLTEVLIQYGRIKKVSWSSSHDRSIVLAPGDKLITTS